MPEWVDTWWREKGEKLLEEEEMVLVGIISHYASWWRWGGGSILPIADKCVITTVRKVQKSKSKHVPKQILSAGIIVPVKKFQKDEKLEECHSGIMEKEKRF